jgi:hypothetical protein
MSNLPCRIHVTCFISKQLDAVLTKPQLRDLINVFNKVGFSILDLKYDLTNCVDNTVFVSDPPSPSFTLAIPDSNLIQDVDLR